jgi:hypothetical protein
MRVRKLVIDEKILQSDTGWRTDDLPPRYSLVYERSRPIRGGWKWRSAKVFGKQGEYQLLALCNPHYSKWQAMLIKAGQKYGSVVARYEYHGDHPGLHVHSDCVRAGVEEGATSIGLKTRLPNASSQHRRVHAWTETGFWESAKSFFRVTDQQGPLI